MGDWSETRGVEEEQYHGEGRLQRERETSPKEGAPGPTGYDVKQSNGVFDRGVIHLNTTVVKEVLVTSLVSQIDPHDPCDSVSMVLSYETKLGPTISSQNPVLNLSKHGPSNSSREGTGRSGVNNPTPTPLLLVSGSS